MTLSINGKTYEAGELIAYVKKLEKENAELNCECRRCVYTDCPCVLSDYGKDRNGICNHFKDVFDENSELKAFKEKCKFNVSDICKEIETENNLTKAKEILKMIVDYYPCYNKTITEQAEQFLNSEVEK